MSEVNFKQDEFRIVKHKRRANGIKSSSNIENQPILQKSNNSEPIDTEKSIKKIICVQEELFSSDYYKSVTAALRESLGRIHQPTIESIISLGLGRIGESTVSQYQLGLLLCLRDVYSVKASVYDPVFSEDDKNILIHFNIDVISDNIEGKFSSDKTTLFYLPHCAKQLSNNLLWTNWGLQLHKCVIISNSFSTILEQSSKRIIEEMAFYINLISPHVFEVAVINCFKFYEVFNDIAVHVFPFDKLQLIPIEFWSNCQEPKYSTDTEFVTKSKLYNNVKHF